MVLFVDTVPLIITNNCTETIWPGIYTLTAGRGPNTGGFELEAGKSRSLEVLPDWNGRVWGRTNCTFNENGTSSTPDRSACLSGDCGALNCTGTGGPATLAEFNLAGGSTGHQNFVDISLVDGYNLPMGLVYQPGPSTSFIPPNMINPSCIATTDLASSPPSRVGTLSPYTNSTYPIPWEPSVDGGSMNRWCPWNNQFPAFAATKPGDGVYPYPDDNIQRPNFDPCLSACSYTGSEADCCTGAHSTADTCGPSLYAQRAKQVCPDAYSYAYDDSTSTFAVQQGGGWEVVYCPSGRSTDILRTFADQIAEFSGNGGKISGDMLAALTSVAYVESHGLGVASSGRSTRVVRGLGVWKVLMGVCVVGALLM